MSTIMQVDHLAEKINKPTRVTFLNSVFKSGLKKELSHLAVGHINVEDGEEAEKSWLDWVRPWVAKSPVPIIKKSN